MFEMEDRAIPSDGSLVREIVPEDDEEEFCSCCEDEEVWKETDEIVNEAVKEELDEHSVKLFFKGVSIAVEPDSGSGFSGIGILIERKANVSVIQVQKKLDFYVEEPVAEYLALMDGLAVAMQNDIRSVHALTDCRVLYDQVFLAYHKIFVS